MRAVAKEIAQAIETQAQADELMRAETMHHVFTHGRGPSLKELAEFRAAIQAAAYRLRNEMVLPHA